MENKKIKVELNDYFYSCGDGCCDEYGTVVKVNGQELPYRNEDVPTILMQVLEFLGYEPYIICKYNDDVVAEMCSLSEGDDNMQID